MTVRTFQVLRFFKFLTNLFFFFFFGEVNMHMTKIPKEPNGVQCQSLSPEPGPLSGTAAGSRFLNVCQRHLYIDTHVKTDF